MFAGELAEQATRLAVNSNSCVNAPTQMAAIEALTGPQESVATMRLAFDERRKIIVEELKLLEAKSIGAPGEDEQKWEIEENEVRYHHVTLRFRPEERTADLEVRGPEATGWAIELRRGCATGRKGGAEARGNVEGTYMGTYLGQMNRVVGIDGLK